jgi:hypothetical protein
MKAIYILFVGLTVVAYANATPTVFNTFCSDVVETLKINGTVHRSDQFRLCMDISTLNWRRDDAVDQDTIRAQIFTQKDNMVHEIFFDKKMQALNCTFVTPPSPTTSTDLPFRFAQLDPEATLNATVKVNGVDAIDYRHLRPAKRVGPGLLPAEDMNWLISKQVLNSAQDLLETSCVETVKGEGTSDGIRNFQKKYTRVIPSGTFDIPKNVKCVPAKPPQVGNKSYNDERFNKY